MKNQDDLLQYFIENEKKSKIWTVISVSMLCVFALAIILLAVNLTKTQKQLEESNIALKKINEDLKVAKAQIEQEKQSCLKLAIDYKVATKELEEMKQSAQVSEARLLEQYAKLEKESNEMRMRLNKPLPVVPVVATTKPKDDYFDNDLKGVGSSNPSKPPINPVKPAPVTTNAKLVIKGIPVYVQYMPGYKSKSDLLIKLIQKEGFKLPQAEEITDNSFDCSVRYFDESKKSDAEALLEKAEKATGLKFSLKYISTPSANYNLEVWIGKFDNSQFNDYIKNDVLKK